MIPFRVFNRDKKEMWIVLNFQPGSDGGGYLASRQVDSDAEGELALIPAKDFLKYRFEGFIEAPED